ncbi:MAG: cadherin repeat domain-containing protein [Candidatus Neomarinimicrobiota bacterium]
MAFILNGCEKTVIAYPGNTQDTDPKAPEGAIDWIIDSSDDGKGQLDENSASDLSIGVLNATDPNPDDEVSYTLDKQTIDGQDVNFFKIVVEDSTGLANLKTNTNDINYEAIAGSKEVEVTIKATDDSPASQSSNFLITVQIVDVNETPYYTNINEVVRFADENIEYNFNKVEWTDTDEGDNPTLTHSGPGWLNISSEGQMTGIPETSDIGNNSFVLTISDGAINVQEEVNIEVRENLAPLFNSTSSIPQNIIVGCWNVNQELVDLSWYDPNNGTQNFAGNDVVSFSVDENVSWMNWSEDGKLFCYTAPENTDEGMSTVMIMLEDNRPNSSKATEYQFDLTVIANDAPVFSNLSSFPSEMNSGDTLSFNIDWVDPNEDQTTFNLTVGIGSNTYSTSQLSWISIDQSGLVTVIPGSNNNGDKTFTFSVSDECFTTQEQKSFTIQ